MAKPNPFAAKGSKPAPGDKKSGKPMPPWLAKGDSAKGKPAMKSGGKVKC
jgi:hypothetical protein